MHCEICFDMERTTELLVLFVILNGFTLFNVLCRCILFILNGFTLMCVECTR